MRQDLSVTANFRLIQRTLSTRITPREAGSVSPLGNTGFDHGESVTITPKPAQGYRFVNWSGDCSGSGSCTLIMDRDRIVIAVFEPIQFTLRTNASPTNGGGLSPQGPRSYSMGTDVVITPVPAPGYKFLRWSGDCSGETASCTLNMTQARTVTAEFSRIQRTLTTRVTPSAGGTVNPSGTNGYPHGEMLTITAQPSAGYVLGRWEGDCSGSGSCTVTMDRARDVTAVFVQQQRTLTTTASPSEGGTISPAGANSYQDGATVTVTATANAGHEFTGWSGDCSGTRACHLVMDGNHSVTANFSTVETQASFDGTFTDGLSGWTKGQFFGCGNDTDVYILEKDTPHSNVLQVKAQGNGGCFTEARVVSTLNLAVANAAQVIVSADIKSVMSTVRRGCGDGGTEVPVTIRLYYENLQAEEKELHFLFSHKTGGSCGNPQVPENRIYNHMTVPENQWVDFTSENLKGIDPAMKRITGIWMSGNGWDYEGRLDNIEITINGAPVPALRTTLTTTATPAGGGSVTPPGTQTREYGSSVTVNATPSAGYKFTGWSGGCSGTEECVLVMDANKSVTANFARVIEPPPPVDTVLKNGDFSDGFNGWTKETFLGCGRHSEARILAQDGPHSGVVQFLANGNGGCYTDTKLTQDLDISVADDSSVVVSADVKTVHCVSWACNTGGFESPVTIELTYRTDNDEERRIIWQFQYRIGTVPPNYYRLGWHENLYREAVRVTQNEWFAFTSDGTKAIDPSMARITKIRVLGNSWDYDGRIDNVKLTVN